MRPSLEESRALALDDTRSNGGWRSGVVLGIAILVHGGEWDTAGADLQERLVLEHNLGGVLCEALDFVVRNGSNSHGPGKAGDESVDVNHLEDCVEELEWLFESDELV